MSHPLNDAVSNPHTSQLPNSKSLPRGRPGLIEGPTRALTRVPWLPSTLAFSKKNFDPIVSQRAKWDVLPGLEMRAWNASRTIFCMTGRNPRNKDRCSSGTPASDRKSSITAAAFTSSCMQSLMLSAIIMPTCAVGVWTCSGRCKSMFHNPMCCWSVRFVEMRLIGYNELDNGYLGESCENEIDFWLMQR